MSIQKIAEDLGLVKRGMMARASDYIVPAGMGATALLGAGMGARKENREEGVAAGAGMGAAAGATTGLGVAGAIGVLAALGTAIGARKGTPLKARLHDAAMVGGYSTGTLPVGFLLGGAGGAVGGGVRGYMNKTTKELLDP